MKTQSIIGTVLSLALLLLVASSGLAQGAQSAARAPWFVFHVDSPGNTGQHTSLAIDPDDNRPFISYYDATEQALRMARYVGSGGNCGPDNDWSCWTIDDSGDVGKYSSIAVTPNGGKLGIAYFEATTGKLKYSSCVTSGTCFRSVQVVDEGLFPVAARGLYTSLKFKANGTPYIAYQHHHPSGLEALMVAHWVGSGGNCGYDRHGAVTGQWQCDTIQQGEGVGQHNSLAIDGDGKLHIAYYDKGTGALWYATNRIGTNCGPSGNSWLCYPVDATGTVGQYASLTVDSHNHFHIAYYDATKDKLKYAVDVDSGGNCGVFGSAYCETIDDMPSGGHPLGVSLAEDGGGYPLIAYQGDDNSLYTAQPLEALGLLPGSGNCGPENPFATWYCRRIDRSATGWINFRHGDYASVAVNSSGLATIAYYGFITSGDGNLKVAQQRMQTFLPLVVRE